MYSHKIIVVLEKKVMSYINKYEAWKVINNIEKICNNLSFGEYTYDEIEKLCYERAAIALINIPDADVVENHRGRWMQIKDKDMGICYKCDNCENIMPVEFNYCPFCGAKMSLSN